MALQPSVFYIHQIRFAADLACKSRMREPRPTRAVTRSQKVASTRRLSVLRSFDKETAPSHQAFISKRTRNSRKKRLSNNSPETGSTSGNAIPLSTFNVSMICSSGAKSRSRNNSVGLHKAQFIQRPTRVLPTPALSVDVDVELAREHVANHSQKLQ